MQQSMLGIGIEQLRRPEDLIKRLRDANDTLSQFLKSQFSEDLKNRINQYNGIHEETMSDDFKRRLIIELNSLMRGPLLYKEERFNHVNLSEETKIQLKRRRDGLSEILPINRLLLDDAYPDEIVRASFGINFSEKSKIILTDAFFDKILINWSVLKNHLVEEDLTDGYLIPQLREGYKRIGWFDDADQCYKFYMDERIKNRIECQAFLDYVRLTILSKYLYGYGVFPIYPLKLGLMILIIFSIVFFVSKNSTQLFSLCPSQFCTAVKDSFVMSIVSFLATPYEAGFGPSLERFLGWIVVSCFLIALANRTLR